MILHQIREKLKAIITLKAMSSIEFCCYITLAHSTLSAQGMMQVYASSRCKQSTASIQLNMHKLNGYYCVQVQIAEKVMKCMHGPRPKVLKEIAYSKA